MGSGGDGGGDGDGDGEDGDESEGEGEMARHDAACARDMTALSCLLLFPRSATACRGFRI